MAAASFTPQSPSSCTYGTSLKILGNFLLELSQSQYFQKT